MRLFSPTLHPPLDALLSSKQKGMVFCCRFICPHVDEQGAFEPKLKVSREH